MDCFDDSENENLSDADEELAEETKLSTLSKINTDIRTIKVHNKENTDYPKFAPSFKPGKLANHVRQDRIDKSMHRLY